MSATLAHAINGFEFDHPFTIHPDGTITEPRDVWAPDVYDDPENDILICGAGWSALTGLTGQYGYSGAVMHSSEFVGKGLAEHLADMAFSAGEPITFVLCVVECEPTDDDPEPEPAGWAILRKVEVTK